MPVRISTEILICTRPTVFRAKLTQSAVVKLPAISPLDLSDETRVGIDETRVGIAGPTTGRVHEGWLEQREWPRPSCAQSCALRAGVWRFSFHLACHVLDTRTPARTGLCNADIRCRQVVCLCKAGRRTNRPQSFSLAQTVAGARDSNIAKAGGKRGRSRHHRE